MKVLLEIRPGEGGKDAQLLVTEQAGLYLRYAQALGLSADVEDQGHL